MMKYIISLLLLIASFQLQAQYNGGSSDGADHRIKIQTTLNGNIGGTNVLYMGGIGDGFSNIKYSSVSFLFRGGKGDGFVNQSFSGYLQSTNAAVLYSGGKADGFAVMFAGGTLDGESLHSIYSGADGDGFSKNIVSGFLSGLPSAAIYNGSTGDGFTVNNYNGLPGGINFSFLFNGGPGDGFAVKNFESFLNGLSSNVIYSGGSGDGFATNPISGAVLPLQLLSFNAGIVQDYVLVQWKTENENGTKFFTVERSGNGNTFNGIANLPATGSIGVTETYSNKDFSPLPGRSYYRLLWTDVDGRKGYSDIKSVEFNTKENGSFLLYPNPNDGKLLNIQLDNNTASKVIVINIYDASGRNIYHSEKATFINHKITINLPATLARGNYNVNLKGEEINLSKVLIVQ